MNITIRILAAADPSLRSALRPLEESVQLGRKRIKKDLDGIADERGAAVKRGTATETSAIRDAGRRREAENRAEIASQKRAAQEELKVFDAKMRDKQRLQRIAEREEQRASRDRSRAADSAAKDSERRAKAENDAIIRESKRRAREEFKLFDEKLRARKEEERDILRVAARAERTEAAAKRRIQSSQQAETRQSREAMLRDFGGRTAGNVQQIGQGALGFAGAFARGAGVDFSIGSAFGRSVSLRRGATDLSNAGYQAPNDEDPVGKARIDPRVIEAKIKEAADFSATDRNQAKEGLGAFVGKTGRLQEGMDLLKELGRLSKATGAEIQDMTSAAGDVSNALGDMDGGEKKLAAVQTIMRQIAGQGKIGAVEIKDLASQMAKLATSANAFEGDPQEIIGTMGALVQMSRAKGGSASATQAATSVQAMVNTLRTPARMDQFKAGGVDILNEKTGLYKSPEAIITESISKTRADPEKFKKMWANVQGARAVEGFADVYRRARSESMAQGGNDKVSDAAGRSAVTKEFQKYRNISMGEKEISDSFAARMNDPDSKSQLFNSKMEDVAERIGDKLLPVLEKLAPKMLELTEAVGNLAIWAADNPFKAVAAALGVSIAKAGLESVLKAGLEKAVGSIAGIGLKGGGTPTGGGAGGGGGPNNLGAGLAIFATAVAITAAGVELIDASFKEKDKTEAGIRNSLLGSTEARANAVTSSDPGVLADSLTALKKQQQSIGTQLDAAKENTTTGKLTGGFSAALNWVSAGEYGRSYDRQQTGWAASEKENELKEEFNKNAEAIAKLEAKLGGNLNVTVTNMPASGGPFVSPDGRVDNGTTGGTANLAQ